MADTTLGAVIRMESMLFLCVSSCVYCLILGLKSTKKDKFSINSDVRTPFASTCLKSNTTYTRGISGTYARISGVSFVANFPKVAESVVCSIMVYMINLFRGVTINKAPYSSVRGSSNSCNDSCFVPIAVNRRESLFPCIFCVKYFTYRFSCMLTAIKHRWSRMFPSENSSFFVIIKKLANNFVVEFNHLISPVSADI